VRRFDPDAVQNGQIYSSLKRRKYSYIGFTFSVGWAEDL